MSYIICEKHNKYEKIGAKILRSGYVCMNKNCPNSFKIFCSVCKNQHRDHTIKLLTIQDLSFLVGRLTKSSFKQISKSIIDALDVMKKFKLIKQFRKKIDILQKEIQRQSLNLIEHTQQLLKQQSICNENVKHIATVLENIQEIDYFNNFTNNSKQLLINLQYNFKKDKLQYDNAEIKQKEDKRRKVIDHVKSKIGELRDYSMKIVEVILHDDDSEYEESEIAYMKKHYQILKLQLHSEQDERQSQVELKNSQITSNRSRLMKIYQHSECQTQIDVISELHFEKRISELKHSHKKQQNHLKSKLLAITTEKQNINKQLVQWKSKFSEKLKAVKQIEINLRLNRSQRHQKQKIKDQLATKIIDMWEMKETSEKNS